MTLEDLKPNSHVAIDGKTVTITGIELFGEGIINVQYRTAEGRLSEEIFYRHDESRFQLVTVGRPWQFDGNGEHFRLVSEAQRIQLAHLFDPLLAVHTSLIEPLPHQITAVYEAMLPRQPLRFLLADDPGAGKTIMAGLLIKELMARGDVKRCLVVCPGSLAEQWQDELYRKFQLPFEILTNDKLEAARTGNWFLENDLTIARLDKLSRNEDVQDKLAADGCHYDLIICDEAHKMSATLAGKEIKYTKRYLLGEKLSTLTRHFLLMTATPHNGKEADFQLFLKLLDGDRFEGRFRTGVHKVDTTDLMRRMVKETLLKFDGRPLFPERRAYTVPYQLSDAEAALYKSVTEYVTNEFNRVDRLDGKRRVTVGFALTILQRRLASSPGAIHASLRRRRERLEARLEELRQRRHTTFDDLELDEDDIEGIEDATDEGFEQAEDDVLDQATAASSIQELQLEIETLQKLEDQAAAVKRNGSDAKWRELSSLINAIFQTGTGADISGYALPPDVPSPKQKLVIFTEHRDTLAYLEQQITTLLGDPESVVVIHGGVKRDRRRAIQEKFLYDPSVKIFLANDAAGEGINLQRAHLMVNYDLPWNPNRLEQRFGRIHRIGQKDVCYLWNLIASGTREGDVFQRLLDKLEQARRSLSGQVFDVLGKLQFDGKPLRDLLIEAVRYGESPEVRDRLNQVIDEGTGQAHLQELLENKALVEDAMDASRVAEIREDMARADARRLQPHYIEAFFLAAFKQLGGKVREREARRYQISNVPARIRDHQRRVATGDTILLRYERIVFEKDLINQPDQPEAAFICPGHPLLDAVLTLTLEQHRDLLKQGAILVDPNDTGNQVSVLFFLEHAIQDGTETATGEARIVSKRTLYIKVDKAGTMRDSAYAPYLDYRPLTEDDPSVHALLEHPACQWLNQNLEKAVVTHALTQVVPEHLSEVATRRQALIAKTRAAVHDRLTKEISHWDRQATELKAKEEAGKRTRLPAYEARRRADELAARLDKRLKELDQEAQLSPKLPLVRSGIMVVPQGLVDTMNQRPTAKATVDTQATAAKARDIVMAQERALGFEPVDLEFERLGYDLESRDPDTGRLRFIEVKGRLRDADTITVTKNEILTSLNKPEDYILAIVTFDERSLDSTYNLHYVREPFGREPDFDVTSVNYNLDALLAKAEAPR